MPSPPSIPPAINKSIGRSCPPLGTAMRIIPITIITTIHLLQGVQIIRLNPDSTLDLRHHVERAFPFSHRDVLDYLHASNPAWPDKRSSWCYSCGRQSHLLSHDESNLSWFFVGFRGVILGRVCGLSLPLHHEAIAGKAMQNSKNLKFELSGESTRID